MEFTRRGFLSICTALAGSLAMPEEAEPIIREIKQFPPIQKDFRVVRYSLGLIPDSHTPIEPGRITILRGRMMHMMRPDRLMLNYNGFNLLHLGVNGEPITEGEISSDFFTSTAYGRMELASIEPGQEMIIAAVNRSNEPRALYGSLIGTVLDRMKK